MLTVRWHHSDRMRRAGLTTCTLKDYMSGSLRWLQRPLVDVKEIKERQAMVEAICGEKALMNTLQRGSGMLRGMPGELVEAAGCHCYDMYEVVCGGTTLFVVSCI